MSDILDVMEIKSFPKKKKKKEKDVTTDACVSNENKQLYAREEYASANKKRKLSAMNRELYNLIGSNVPPMAIDNEPVAKNLKGKKFKERLVNTKKDVPWRLLGFKNGARNDDLVLYHWVKVSEDEGSVEVREEEVKQDLSEYRYAKYNTKLAIPEFTKEEYEEAVKIEEERLRIEEEAKAAREKSKQEGEKALVKQEGGADKTDKEKAEEKVEEKVEEKAEEHVNKDEGEKKDKMEDTNTVEEKGNGKNEDKEDSDTPMELTQQLNEVKVNESNSIDVEEEIKEKDQEKEKEEIKEREWTYEETKRVFELCEMYDMRWAVIYDRYQDEYNDRSIEDLKKQVYYISASILEKRGNPSDVALIKALRSFDKEKEINRKFYLNRLIHRAPTEIAEEESLVIEARKFEIAAKKMLYERGQLLQLLDSPQSSASVQQYLTSQGLTQLYNSLMASDKSRKRKAEVPVAPLLGPNAIPHTQHLMMSNPQNMNSGNLMKDGKKRQNKAGMIINSNNNNNKGNSKLSEVQQLLEKNLSSEELEVYGIEIHNDRIQPGVFVRSQKIATFKPSVQAKVQEILGQLGLSNKPNVPTGKVVKRFDELLQRISKLVDMKKQSDKLIAEIELIKRQKGIM
ncbi:hypothetical protein CANINC_004399 [Pichia inconspicua]|uniref:SWR1-complex protein 4 n=1 Tax=Pichia inconspicua TaxID=52247 RepID=A0A4T0WWE3_9ASCO|nr:hypothetical protein CANINC_004399 [[Candida] inconspicua]